MQDPTELPGRLLVPLVEKRDDEGSDDDVLDVGLLAVADDPGHPIMVAYVDEASLAERVPGVPFAVAETSRLFRFALSRGITAARVVRPDGSDLVLDDAQMRNVAEAASSTLMLVTVSDPPDDFVRAAREMLSGSAARVYLFETSGEGRPHFVLGVESTRGEEAELERLKGDLRRRLAGSTADVKVSLLPLSPAKVAQLESAGVPKLA